MDEFGELRAERYDDGEDGCDTDKTDIKLFYLGEMYRRGLYVKKDKEKAKYYLNQLMELLLEFDEEPKEDLMFYSRARASLKKLEEGIEEVI